MAARASGSSRSTSSPDDPSPVGRCQEGIVVVGQEALVSFGGPVPFPPVVRQVVCAYALEFPVLKGFQDGQKYLRGPLVLADPVVRGDCEIGEGGGGSAVAV